MQHFSRARVLLPGGHNGNQVQDAGLVGCESQRRQYANVYVHAHGHVRATWHARTCALRPCMPCMPGGLAVGLHRPDRTPSPQRPRASIVRCI